MLVLSRQRDEKLKFSNVYIKDADGKFVPVDAFFVTVTDIRGDKVRLGIDAPQLIGVDRCGPDGHSQTLTDETGRRRQIDPPSSNDPRPQCPKCHSHLSIRMQGANAKNLRCVNCKTVYACPHTQTKRHQLRENNSYETCINCGSYVLAGGKS
jgi:sRNA-binding carbon storage regulator CsrA